MEKYITCYLMRGGTSKGGCFLASELPQDLAEQDHILCRVYGSNDANGRQIDGIGGATSTTSKAVIVGKITNEKNSVSYTFCQVEIAKQRVDRRGNCGNMSSVVGPFAIEMGLVDEITEPVTVVNIFNTNTNKRILSHVPVKNGKVIYHGDYAISGVPGTASRIKLDFVAPGGAVTGKLLPTGQAKDRLRVADYGDIDVSIVDATNPLVFVRAKDVGLQGNELPKQIDNQAALLNRLLAIRAAAAVRIGLAKDSDDAKHHSPAVPKLCFVAPAEDYINTAGQLIQKQSIDLQARMLSMGKLHPVLAITGAVCLGIAAKIPGTLVNEAVSGDAADDQLRIGHCSGMISVSAQVVNNQGDMHAISGTVYRTTRILLKGAANISE